MAHHLPHHGPGREAACTRGTKLAHPAPPIDNGLRSTTSTWMQPLSAELTCPKIEAEMKKIVKADLPLERFALPAEEGQESRTAGQRNLQGGAHRGALPARARTSPSTSRGTSPTCAPAPTWMRTGRIKVQRPSSSPPATRAYWRGDCQPNKTLQRIYGIAFPKKERAGRVPANASRRPRSGTTASWARSWACSCSWTRAPASPSSCPRAWC